MNFKFYMPTKVVTGKGCIKENAALLKGMGSKALIITGKQSAKINGSQSDLQAALDSVGIEHAVYDDIEANPSIESVRIAADFARKEGADFIIGCGGGSPMDASKAVAVLTANDVDDVGLYSGVYANPVLPVVAVPTTAGTGSEVTPYTVLTDHKEQTKRSFGAESIFPKVAFLDATYTEKLPVHITINTAIDALSHSLESYLSRRATEMSSFFAAEGLRLLGRELRKVDGDISFQVRENLLYGSMLSGMAITHTGTTILHSMGYPLTYFHGLDHGRAHGLIMAEYLSFISRDNQDKVDKVLEIMGFESLDEFRGLLDKLLVQKEKYTREELKIFSAISSKTKSLGYTLTVPTEEELFEMYVKSVG